MENKTIETGDRVRRYVLASVETDESRIGAEGSLNELNDLLETAGGLAVGRIVQNLERPNPATYLGKGKVEELKEMVLATGADGIIADDELSPAQLRNLADALEVQILDRTLLILEIFSERAQTKEGQLQVELARLQYKLSRLSGLGVSMSRQGGEAGVHARGAGETKLELDRRYIRRRIDTLRQQLAQVAEQREIRRKKRKKQEIPVVALIGYTNAGKSTIFNRLTEAGVLEEDRLFATLDTTTRRLALPGGQEIILTDTVGFIHKLPHHLIRAFRATLEEAAQADILVHVIDASEEEAQLHMEVTMEEMEALGAGDKPVITVYNKKDRMSEDREYPVPGYVSRAQLKISALNPEDLQILLRAVERVVEEQNTYVEILLPYTEGALSGRLHESALILAEEYREDGLYMKLKVPEKEKERLTRYSL